MEEQRKKAIDIAFTQIEKMYGKGAVMLLGEQPQLNIESISDRLAVS
jgi:RecA/RadA recombinase